MFSFVCLSVCLCLSLNRIIRNSCIDFHDFFSEMKDRKSLDLCWWLCVLGPFALRGPWLN